MKRLLKKPPPKLRLLKLLPRKALTPLLLAPTPLLLVPTLPPLALKLLLRPLTPLLLRLLTPLLRLLTPRLLLRLKKRSKSQPFGAMTETRNGRSSFGKAAFFFVFKGAWAFPPSAPSPCVRRAAVSRPAPRPPARFDEHGMAMRADALDIGRADGADFNHRRGIA